MVQKSFIATVFTLFFTINSSIAEDKENPLKEDIPIANKLAKIVFVSIRQPVAKYAIIYSSARVDILYSLFRWMKELFVIVYGRKTLYVTIFLLFSVLKMAIKEKALLARREVTSVLRSVKVRDRCRLVGCSVSVRRCEKKLYERVLIDTGELYFVHNCTSQSMTRKKSFLPPSWRVTTAIFRRETSINFVNWVRKCWRR